MPDTLVVPVVKPKAPATRTTKRDPKNAAPPVPPGNPAQTRVTQLVGESLVKAGGIGILPRRGYGYDDSQRLLTMEGLEYLIRYKPVEALQILSGVIPELDLARTIYLRLGITEGSARLKAMTQAGPAPAPGATPKADGAPKDASEEDPAVTTLIEEFFERLPAEIGGYTGMLEQLMQQVLFTGMAVVEGVPAPDGNGLKEAWPVDSTTVFFRREQDMTLGLYQRQYGTLGANTRPLLGNSAQLNMQRTFWDSLDRLPSNPYGQATFSTALNEIVKNERFLWALDRAWHRVGLPKYDVEFDFEMWTNLADRLVDYKTEEGLHDWVIAKYKATQQEFAEQDPDSAFFHAKGTQVNVTGQAGSWPDVPGIYNMRRWRFVIALKMLPTLMGINDGATETWSITEWRAWTAQLRSVVECAVRPLIKAVQLHLQLLGYAHKVVLDYTPAAFGQRLLDAQAMQLEILNQESMIDDGFISQDEASMKLTGTPAVGPRREDVFLAQGLQPDGMPPPPKPMAPDNNTNPDRVAKKDKVKPIDNRLKTEEVLRLLLMELGVPETRSDGLVAEYAQFAQALREAQAEGADNDKREESAA